jgi:hypothetical protein
MRTLRAKKIKGHVAEFDLGVAQIEPLAQSGPARRA